MSSPDSRAGFVAVIGAPNAGKSTLVNALVGAKVSIVSDRPQTTRHRLLGIASLRGGQLLLVDTPGIHREQIGSEFRLLKAISEHVRMRKRDLDPGLQRLHQRIADRHFGVDGDIDDVVQILPCRVPRWMGWRAAIGMRV